MRTQPLVLLTSLALLLTACAPIQSAVGSRSRLDKTPLKAVSVELAEGSTLYPGGTAKLVARATAEDGQVLVTEGAGGGTVRWDSYRLVAHDATVQAGGVVALDEDPRAYAARALRVSLTALSNPERRAEVELPVRFDKAFTADFSGAPGRPGFPGSAGNAGAMGIDGSLDRSNPTQGVEGGPGWEGTPGGRGGDGADGADLQVHATLHPGPGPLLQVRVTAGGTARYFLVDPKGGSLLIRSDGGTPGAGGKGGKGGAGGIGGLGVPQGRPGPAGSDGRAGARGSGGSGGRITVWLDPSAQPYAQVLRFSNQGRSGGHDGPPVVIREAVVPPLW
ncbi:MAG: hypothetical protein IPL96_15675 [Holophagaceae bacterium]|nr:hypothetical protein [Holophagaceae bacterium]